MGGLGNLDWDSHVKAFNSQWMTRYVDPSVSQWKDLMDFFSPDGQKGKQKFPEGRGILFSKLSTMDKIKLMADVPKTHTTHERA